LVRIKQIKGENFFNLKMKMTNTELNYTVPFITYEDEKPKLIIDKVGISNETRKASDLEQPKKIQKKSPAICGTFLQFNGFAFFIFKMKF